MKILICVNDLISDEPGLLLGRMIAQQFETEITLFHVLSKKKKEGDRDRADQHLRTRPTKYWLYIRSREKFVGMMLSSGFVQGGRIRANMIW